ncbi:MAG: hypothetical protein ISS70_08965 [Phycisphaerae bacterium]|nr:hypothetical protein [Phycisphaerae bacterium]
MPDFGNPFGGLAKDRKLTDAELVLPERNVWTFLERTSYENCSDFDRPYA